MSNLTQSIEALHKGIVENDGAAQQEVFQAIDLALSDVGKVPDNEFGVLLQIMEDKSVLNSKNSASLFKLFEYNHDLLTDKQLVLLWAALCKAFPALVDSASLILVAELVVSLGDSPQRVFDTLKGFMRIANETARALLPYGFKVLAQTAIGTPIYDQCKTMIETMEKDASPIVRNEATRASSKLKMGPT